MNTVPRHLSNDQFAKLSQEQQEIEMLAERLQEQDVLACQSALVDDLLKTDMDGFGIDDLENLYPDPDGWTYEQCKEYASDHGIDLPDDDDEADIEDYYSAIRDQAEPNEVYEWWLVTDYLAEQLDAIGEPLIRNGYGNWWGRTCTGQSMMLDGTLQQIARNMAQR